MGSVSGGFNAISRNNAISKIPQIGVQGLTIVYPISGYMGPRFNIIIIIP